jgi:hypothetical protein
MILKEAQWINTRIKNLPTSFRNKNCLNLGSSTSDFVVESQPYIQDLVVGPLASKFNKLVNVDIKNAKGVDLIANFLTEEGRSSISRIQPRMYLVSNLLEHIPDPIQGIESLSTMLKKGDLLILTGPRFYPLHPDPIDNRFRPNRKELRNLMSKDFKILELEIVWGGTVLTANRYSATTVDLFLWSRRQITLQNIRKDPKFFYRTIRNIFYPALAFCGLFERL